jgi:chemotaxis protein MotB
MKKETPQEDPNKSMIELMTISLFIILLAFFILLNAISEIDDKKKQAAMNSIVKNFGGKTMVERGAETTNDEVFSNGVSPVDFSGLVTKDNTDSDKLKIHVTSKKTTLRIPDETLFYSYGTRIKQKAYPLLDQLAEIIKKNEMAVEITAHTDNVPVPVQNRTNSRQLSVLRSAGVVEYFIKKNIAPEKFIACGWGEFKPVVSNKTPQSRKINRRIDIAFVHNQRLNKGKGIFIFKDFFFNVAD